jgi:hypothetical protein
MHLSIDVAHFTKRAVGAVTHTFLHARLAKSAWPLKVGHDTQKCFLGWP